MRCIILCAFIFFFHFDSVHPFSHTHAQFYFLSLSNHPPQAHPVAMACAYEQIKHLIKNDIVGHVARVAPVMEEGMKRLAENHPSIKQYRSIGLFGCFDTMNPDGTCPQLQHEAANQAFATYKKAFNEAGLIGLLRPPLIHVCPPLIITEEELNDGFERHDKALDALDQALGF